jgi:hypothetical protein
MIYMLYLTKCFSSRIYWYKQLSIFLFLLSVLTSCALPALPSSTPQIPILTAIPTLAPQETLITFRLTLNQAIPPGDSVLFNILDEITGLAINPTSYVMVAEDATHYSVIIPFRLGSVVKYRYNRQGASNLQEHLSDGRPVRYRLYHVEGPGVVQDTVSRWTDTFYTGDTGRIIGQVKDSSSDQPIPNILISAGGTQVFTRADGSYIIEGLPPGIHNIVAYALDGMYQTYQQGAIIAADSTTPASLHLTQSQVVPVVFTVSIPESTPPDAPLRLAGNLYQLGNTFADLSGGVSILASRMPTLTKLPDGSYVATINLPVGADMEYKYTLGDGLWNAEHASDGTFKTRHIIVPGIPTRVDDIVENWGESQVSSIRFDVTVPVYTPVDDGISIQINPGFGWLQPLPMWPGIDPQGRSIWRFILISPLDVLETIQYRICRADQCGAADDRSTPGINPIGHVVTTGMLPQTILYPVSNWLWFPGAPEQASIPNVPITPRAQGFLTGIGFDPSYHPSWESHIQRAIDMTSDLGANWLIFRPTWTFTRNQPPVLEILPSQDIMLPDLGKHLTQASSLGLNVSMFPALHFPIEANQWWQDSERDFAWWIVWFDHYAQFLIHHADISEQVNAQSLILGGDFLAPAMPGGVLVDGTPSGVPADAEIRWRALIEQIRGRYQGTLVWALSYPDGIQNPPPFIDTVDQVIILWSASLSSSNNPSVADLHAEAGRILDQEILPFYQLIGMPVILAIEYPSADGSATGCVPASSGGCIPARNLTAANPILNTVSLDLQEQAHLYNAMLLAVNDRDWISGFVSMGFYPPVALQDPSISVYDKPASGVLWYWFPRLLGIEP